MKQDTRAKVGKDFIAIQIRFIPPTFQIEWQLNLAEYFLTRIANHKT